MQYRYCFAEKIKKQTFTCQLLGQLVIIKALKINTYAYMKPENVTLQYRNNMLHWHNQSLSELVERYQTPLYVYAKAQVAENYSSLEQALAAHVGPSKTMICYAVKANSNIAILKLFFTLGAHFDTVSKGEIFRCLTAGIPADSIVFSGVGKTAAELVYAITNKVKLIVVESLPELELLNSLALQHDLKVRCLLRLNPDIDYEGDKKIRTGHRDDKFGIDLNRASAIVRNIENYPGLELQGFSVHIGSQICSLEPYEQAFTKIKDFVLAHFPKPKYLDFGGGIGINYKDNPTIDLTAYANLLGNIAKLTGAKNAMVEPGRYLIANAGLLLTQVTYVKHSLGKTFLIVDAAMNDFPRPAIYNAHHEVMALTSPEQNNSNEGDILLPTYEIVGAVCESSDVLARERTLPPILAGQYLAFRDTGAYCASMSSNYNSRLKCAEVLLYNGRHALITKRQDWEELVQNETIPDWIAA